MYGCTVRTAISRTTVTTTLPVPPGMRSPRFKVGAIAHGWVELTDDPTAPSLCEPPARVDQRSRLRLPRGGVDARFGRGFDDPVLTVAVQQPDSPWTWLLAARLPLLCDLQDSRTRLGMRLLQAHGWCPPWVAPGGPAQPSLFDLGGVPA